MANFFDQFDAPIQPTPQAQANALQQTAPTTGNYFDQFDQPAAAAPAKQPFGLADTWPARLAKSIYSAVTLPGEVFQAGYEGRPTGVPQSANMPGGESTENIGRVVDLATLASPVAPRAVATLAKPSTLRAPTQEALDTAINKGFDVGKKSGAEVTSAALPRFSQDAQTRIFGEHSIDANLAPRTYQVLGQLERAPADSTVTFANLHSLRQYLGNIASDAIKSGAGNEYKAARTAQQSLDTYLSNIPQADFVAGKPQAAANALSDAIGNAAAKFRSERIQQIADVAKGNVEAANTYGQLGRQLKAGANQFLKGGETGGFSASELAQAEALRRAGRLPGMAGAALGGSGGPWGLLLGILSGGIAPVAGAGLKQLESFAAQRQFNKLSEMVRARSPLGQQMQAIAVPQYQSFAQNPQLWALIRQQAPYFPQMLAPPNQ